MFLDLNHYLPDDILTKVDRASMGVSLETRAPFLNHNVIEYAWNMPLNMKIRNGKGKWVLRKILENYVPKNLIDRPKMGFGVPIDEWLRGPLMKWSSDLLSESLIVKDGFFDFKKIDTLQKEHKSGKKNHHHKLWNILMFNLGYIIIIKNMKKALIIGGECLSLMKFRGELLKSFKAQHYEVYACAGGKSKQATKWFKDIGIIFIPIQFRRTGLNPFSDLLFFLKLVKTIKKINPDIILTYTIKPVIYGLLASHICKVKNCYALITGLGYSFLCRL